LIRSLLLLALLLFAQSGSPWQETPGPNQQAADSSGFDFGGLLEDTQELADDGDSPQNFTGSFTEHVFELAPANFAALTPRRNVPLPGSTHISGNGIRAPPSIL
jgi:hypothetical protein